MGAGRHHFEFGAALGAKLVEAREKLAAVLSQQFAELEDILIVEYAHSLEAALAEAAAGRKASEEEKDFEQQRAAAVEEARREAAEKERALEQQRAAEVEEARREAAEKERALEQQRAAEAEGRRKAAEEALELERQRAKAEEEAKEKREKEAARLRELELDRQKEEEKEEKARKAREEAKRAEEEGRQKAEEMRKKGLDELEAKRKAADKEAVVGRPKAEEGFKPVVAAPSAVQADTAQRKKEESQENGPTAARSEVPKVADIKAPTAAAPPPDGGQGLGAGLQGRLHKELADSRKKLEERSQGKEERQAAPPQESDPTTADVVKARLQKELAENFKKLEENTRRVGGIAFPTKNISDAATVSAEQAFEKLASHATLTADEVALLNSMEPSKLSERLVEDCRPHVEDQDPEGFGRMWIVIGGIGKGGIVVRRSEDKGSPNLPARLVPGARIEELELRGNRLHYRRIRGDGPNFGWINVEFDGRKLVVLETS